MRSSRLSLVTLVLAALVAAACQPGGGDGGDEALRVAFLLPESKTARYETQDRPNFERRLKELCAECEIIYSNADQDASKQQQQAEAALTRGADVMVLDPVDSEAASVIVGRAKAQDVPVISYDRLILNSDVDYYISFDNERVGRLQAESLVEKLKTDGGSSGSIVMINGAPTDNNAKLFKGGAHGVLDTSGFSIGREYDTPDWSPDAAQRQMEQAITALGRDGFLGVYAANDGTAGGAIAAMKGAGIDPRTKPVTGQDAELAAIQRIISGEQYMTVYKAVRPEAEAAAELAVALAREEEPKSGLVNNRIDNGQKMVPSILLTPVAVTADKIRDTVVKDEFWKVEQICTPQLAADCARLGLTA